MDKTRLFHWLSKQASSVLLDLLSSAYDEMKHDQREAIFGRHCEALPPAPVDGETLVKEVEAFRQASLDGAYYAPFNINSRNFSYIPEETKEWFERLDDLLEASSELTAQRDHISAIACFNTLYELIDTMERGEEIVFVDEYGSWMIPGDKKQYIALYMASLAATSTLEEFARIAVRSSDATAGNRSQPVRTPLPYALLPKSREHTWKRKFNARTSEREGTFKVGASSSSFVFEIKK